MHRPGQRPVRQHQVDLVHRQQREQVLEAALAAVEPRRIGQGQRRREHAVGQGLDHRAGDPDAQRCPPGAAAVMQRILEFFADVEHALGVLEHEVADLGQLEPAPGAPPQRFADHRLEHADLAADRLRRHVQPLAGLGHAAAAADHPEVVQVLVVQRAGVHAGIVPKKRIREASILSRPGPTRVQHRPLRASSARPYRYIPEVEPQQACRLSWP